jgi:hypothetical protein
MWHNTQEERISFDCGNEGSIDEGLSAIKEEVKKAMHVGQLFQILELIPKIMIWRSKIWETTNWRRRREALPMCALVNGIL